jgi:hypothetical protein
MFACPGHVALMFRPAGRASFDLAVELLSAYMDSGTQASRLRNALTADLEAPTDQPSRIHEPSFAMTPPISHWRPCPSPYG